MFIDKGSHTILTEIFGQDFHNDDNDSVGIAHRNGLIDSESKELFDESLANLVPYWDSVERQSTGKDPFLKIQI